MKKILSLVLLLCCALCVDAQTQRKTWDFTKGISDATLDNLVADPNWTVTYRDDGTFNQAVDAAKMSGELTANGQIIEELRGLRLGTGGLNAKGSNYIIAYNKFRLSRKSEQIILRVVPGQTITIKARSANTTATDRGFQGDANMEYISGPANGICLGANVAVEDRDERGDYTLVWQVKEDAEVQENDSLDVTITASPNGGLDISLVQIDNGDDAGDNNVNIAFLYDSSYQGYDLGADGNRSLLNDLGDFIENNKIYDIDINNNAELTSDSLLFFDVVILSRAINPANPFVSSIKEAIAFVPMLNNSASLYETWGYGKAVASGTNALTVAAGAQSSTFFYDSEYNEWMYDENGRAKFFDESEITGYTADAGTYFANDSVWAKAGAVNGIHVHNADRNAYMLLPLTYGNDDATWQNELAVLHAVDMLAATKKNVTNTSKPAVSQSFAHRVTTVTLASNTKGAVIYYTTDGSEPQIGGQVYTGPFEITTEGVTVKAISKADGYLVSDVVEAAIEIHELATPPTITYEPKDGYTEVTLTPANKGEFVYYNITGSNAIAQSEAYADQPITLTKHATITAFTAATETLLQSETVSENIPVLNEKVRLDVVSHFDANKTDWSINGANPSYYNTKSGHSYWSDNLIGDYVEDPETGADLSEYEPLNDIRYHNPNNGWEIRTAGQVMFWQSNGLTHNVGDGGGYNPQTALDDDLSGTGYCISFGGSGTANAFGKKNPAYTGSIQSTEAFQGPFDLVSNISATVDPDRDPDTGEIIELDIRAYVTTDTLNGEWTQIGNLKAGTVKRLWKHTVLGYEGTDKVFVKVCAPNGAAVFDLFIMNSGELSEEYTGIKDVTTGKEAEGEIVRTLIYSVNGTQLDKAAGGINIVKEIYADGAVKTRKVMVK